MKPVVLAVLFGVLTGCAASPPVQQDEGLRALTFNIRYNTAQDGENAWPNRRAAVASLIRFYAPDLLGLQEVLLVQRDQLAEDLADYALLGVGRDDGATAGEFAPIAYLTERLELVESGHFWLSPTPEEPSVGWDAALPRIATWARFRDRASGVRVLAVNAHFDHRGLEARRMSAIQIRDWIGGNREACEVVIVLGDFNAPPSEAAYQEIVAGGMLVDTREVSETPPFGPPGTFSGFDVLEAREAPIDHVFTGAGTRVVRHGVLTQHDGGRLPSDHYPVLADIAPGACAAGG